jgi:6-bladed beta-propeller protein
VRATGVRALAVLVVVGGLALGAAPAAAKYKLVNSWGGVKLFKNLAGVALDGHGHVWVADTRVRRVEEFTTSGGFLRQFNSGQRGLLVMRAPTGVALDGKGRVYVADGGSASHDGLLWQFNSAGKWLRSWNVATHGRSSDTEAPFGVAVGNGSLYATDLQADAFEDTFAWIERWTLGPHEILEWGGTPNGSGPPGSPFRPEGIAVAPSGDVYDADGSQVNQYSSTGSFIRTWGKSGSGPGRFGDISGVAVDRHGTVYVADAGNAKVHKFDAKGRFIADFPFKNKFRKSGFHRAWVAVDRSGTVFVTDNGNNRVQKFKPIHPQTTITSGPKGKTSKSLVRFKFKSSEPGPGSKFICDLRGPKKGDRTVTDCNLGSSAFYLLKTGRYTLRVTAVDGEGVRDRTPAKRRFRVVDGTAPTVTPPTQRLVKGNKLGTGVPVTLRWSASDNSTDASQLQNVLQEADGDGTTFGAFATVAGPKAGMRRRTLSLAPSFTFHEFRAQSTDRAGNVATSAPGTAFRALVADDPNSLIHYTGSWATSNNGNDYGGAAQFSGTAGSTATISAGGGNAAVVMPLAAGLGKARICLDTGPGSCSVVNLGSGGATVYKEMVFVRNALDPAVSHTIKITVLSGQVGLDAIVLLG